jgi:hypothetical protein
MSSNASLAKSLVRMHMSYTELQPACMQCFSMLTLRISLQIILLPVLHSANLRSVVSYARQMAKGRVAVAMTTTVSTTCRPILEQPAAPQTDCRDGCCA